MRPSWHYHLCDVGLWAGRYVIGRDGTNEPAEARKQLPCRGIARPSVGPEASSPRSSEKHTALGDALWAKAIYEAVMSRE